MCRFDKLGNVNHSKQRSLDVVLPVEATKGSDSRQPLSDEEDAWKGNMGSPGARGYVLDEEVHDGPFICHLQLHDDNIYPGHKSI